MSMTIGVDIGGTKIAAGLVDDEGNILRVLRKPSPARHAKSVVETVLTLVERLRADCEVVAIGVGAAGFVNADRDRVIFAPNLAWRDEPLGVHISEATGLPTVIENDANAAAWGEFRFGAARGYRSAAIITVGTGIGGGIVINNELLRAAREGARTDRERSKVLLDLADGDPEAITGLMITEAAHAGCSGALEAFDEVSRWLGQGMADLGALFDPDVFVLAGGVSEAGDVLLSPARKSYEQLLTAREYRPIAPVKLAELGNDAGMIGAADLARRRD